jgi:uncharacterized protein (TIGR00251 family)
MILRVRAVPRSKTASVEKIENNLLKVHLRSPASDGRANRELLEVLAEHFGVKKSEIKILKGLMSRDKMVSVVSSA